MRKAVEDRIMQFLTVNNEPDAEQSDVNFNSQRWMRIAEHVADTLDPNPHVSKSSTKAWRRDLQFFVITRDDLKKFDDASLVDLLVYITRRYFIQM
jgi:hypothetical protein